MGVPGGCWKGLRYKGVSLGGPRGFREGSGDGGGSLWGLGGAQEVLWCIWVDRGCPVGFGRVQWGERFLWVMGGGDLCGAVGGGLSSWLSAPPHPETEAKALLKERQKKDNHNLSETGGCQ